MLRAKGIHAFGFSPLRRTPILLHDHDEYITESTYREGIEVYEQLIPKLAGRVPTDASHPAKRQRVK